MHGYVLCTVLLHVCIIDHASTPRPSRPGVSWLRYVNRGGEFGRVVETGPLIGGVDCVHIWRYSKYLYHLQEQLDSKASVDQVGERITVVGAVQPRNYAFHRCEDAVKASVILFFSLQKLPNLYPHFLRRHIEAFVDQQSQYSWSVLLSMQEMLHNHQNRIF